MSWQAVDWALDHPGASGTVKLVLIAIARHADAAGKCWPSIHGISERIGMSRRTVGTLFRELEATGVITLEGPEGKAAKITLVGFADAVDFDPGHDLPAKELPAPAPPLPAKNLHPPREESASPPAKNLHPPREESSHESITEEITQSFIEKRRGTRRPVRRQQPGFDLGLPEWLPPSAWSDFVDFRRRIGKRMTDRAVELLIADIEENIYRPGHSVVEAINRSIMRGWQGVFPPSGARPAIADPEAVEPAESSLDHLDELHRLRERELVNHEV